MHSNTIAFSSCSSMADIMELFFQLVPEEAIFGYGLGGNIQINAGEFVTTILLMLGYFFVFGYVYDRLGPRRSD